MESVPRLYSAASNSVGLLTLAVRGSEVSMVLTQVESDASCVGRYESGVFFSVWQRGGSELGGFGGFRGGAGVDTVRGQQHG